MIRSLCTKNCTGPNCNRPTQARNLCVAHNKQRERGKQLTEIVKHLAPEDRFMKFVEKTDSCWIWKRPLTFEGYGQFQIKTGLNKVFAHRYSYEIHTGIKLGKKDTLDHRCRNRACVNPAHLDRVSQAVNTERMLAFHAMKSEIERLRSLLKLHKIDVGPSIFGED